MMFLLMRVYHCLGVTKTFKDLPNRDPAPLVAFMCVLVRHLRWGTSGAANLVGLKGVGQILREGDWVGHAGGGVANRLG